MPSIKDYIANLKGDKRKLVVTLNNKGISASDSETFTDLVPKINAIGGADKKDVNFYDYKGVRVASYTTQEFLGLTELPENPIRAGLTAQGWNWTLEDAKAFVSLCGILDIGQMYIPTDEATKIHLSLISNASLSPYLNLYVDGTVSIDWGDGSEQTEVTGTSIVQNSSNRKCIQHNYSKTGDYIISIAQKTENTVFAFHTAVSYGQGTTYLITEKDVNVEQSTIYSTVYSNNISEVNIGKGLTSPSGFNTCRNLNYISLPNTITTIPNNCFEYCINLKAVILPTSLNITSAMNYWFSRCENLELVSFPKAKNTRRLAYLFQNCASLKRITTDFSFGSGVFDGCYSLKEAAIYELNTSLFTNCYSLEKVVFAQNTYSRHPYENCFNNCQSFKEFIGNIAHIGGRYGTSGGAGAAFYGCGSLETVKSTGNVYDIIGNNNFMSCGHLKTLDFSKNTSVCSLASASQGFNSDLKILVPATLYANWVAATNWSTYASQIYPVDEDGNILDIVNITYAVDDLSAATLNAASTSVVESIPYVLPTYSDLNTSAPASEFFFIDQNNTRYALGSTINPTSDLTLTLTQVVPEDATYTVLDYIEATGTQYIDTGITGDSTLDVKADMQVTSNTINNVFLFGARDANMTNRYELFLYARGTASEELYFYCGTSNYPFAYVYPRYALSSRHVWETKLLSNKQQVYQDGTALTMQNTTTVSAFTGGSTLYVFATNVNGVVSGNIPARLWSAKIMSGSNIVALFIPVLDANNVPCLYDRVTGTYHYNLGTGDFSYGTK